MGKIQKLKCNIYAPFTSFSFFGEKGRSFARDIISLKGEQWDIRLINYYLNTEKIGVDISDLQTGSDREGVEICFTVGAPSIFQMKGSLVNVGITDTCSITDTGQIPSYIDKCNMMNKIIVFSEYSKDTLLNMRDGERYITTPIEVVSESPTLTIPSEKDQKRVLDGVTTDWNFLCEGFWDVSQKEYGGINKDNIQYITKIFLDTFKDTDNPPGLIINARGSAASTVDMHHISKRLREIVESIKYSSTIPSVYLINGDLNNDEQYLLYNDPSVKAYVHIPQRTDSVMGELNFSTTGKPMIISGWAAQSVLNHPGDIVVGGNIINMNNVKGTPQLTDVTEAGVKSALYDMYYHYDDHLKDSSEIEYLNMYNNTRDDLSKIIEKVFS